MLVFCALPEIFHSLQRWCRAQRWLWTWVDEDLILLMAYSATSLSIWRDTDTCMRLRCITARSSRIFTCRSFTSSDYGTDHLQWGSSLILLFSHPFVQICWGLCTEEWCPANVCGSSLDLCQNRAFLREAGIWHTKSLCGSEDWRRGHSKGCMMRLRDFLDLQPAFCSCKLSWCSWKKFSLLGFYCILKVVY